MRRWNDGDRELDPAEIHPDVVVYSALTGDEFRGTSRVVKWMTEIDEQFEVWDTTIEEIRDASGDRLLVLGSVHFRGRTSGVEIDQPMGWIWEFQGDRVSAMHNFVGHDAAFEAAGPA